MSTTSSGCSVKESLLALVERHQAQLRELIQSLPESLDDLAAAEELVRRGVLQLGRAILQSWSETAQAQTEAPQCAECADGMRHKGYVVGPLVTTLGSVRVRRARFRCEQCGREQYPHDTRLRFLGHAVSWPLAKVMGRLGAQLPFEQARQNLAEDYGVQVSKHLLQQVCEQAGAAILDREDQERERLQSLPCAEQLKQLPDSPLSPEKAYVFADGTMLHSDGEWREIRVASVAAVDRNETVLTRDQRARFLSCTDFGWQLLLLARGAGYHRAKTRAFIADGARWLWDLADTHFPDAVQILDWYHLSEHVHAAAALLYGEGSTAAERFSQSRLNELWEGRVSTTLRRLRELRKRSRSPAKRESLRKLLVYLDHNRRRIDYPRYRALGLHVGSGQVEGACKTLVGARCKQAGMRNWTPRGVEGVLRLRADLQTGRYRDLWTPPHQTAA
jgi:hypothetical protein